MNKTKLSPMNSELQNEEIKYVTPEYLLTHGFFQYKSEAEGDIHDIPFGESDALYFREIKFDRRICVVAFSPYNGDPKEGYNAEVYFQEDAGCGFVCIPFPWWDLSVEYFESVYYGIRGERPKLQPEYFSEFEVIEPKQLPESNQNSPQ